MKDVYELRIQITKKEKFPRLYDFDMFEDKDVQLKKEEIDAAVKAAAGLGVKSIRFTGGDPLERDELTELIEAAKAVDGIEEVSISTNGVFLVNKIKSLKEAGLDGVEIFLDTFFEEKYIYMTGGGPIEEAMDGMEAAVKEGLKVRIGATMINGLNDDEILNFGQFALNEPVDVVFYEKPNKEGAKLKESEKELKFMAAEDIKKKFKGAVKVPSKDPLIEFCKWFEAKGKIGFVSLKQASEFGPEITADGKLKKFLTDSQPEDIKTALGSENPDEVKAALEKNL